MDDSRIIEYIQKGAKDQLWYKETRETVVDLFGEEQASMCANLLAATSINTSLKANLTLFRKAKHEMENGLEFSDYLPNIKKQLESLRAGGEISGRKIRNFAAAINGDTSAVVVDIWLLRAFKMNRQYYRNASADGKRRGAVREGGPTKRDYDFVEKWVTDYANANGFEPREVSAMIWSGVRSTETGGSNPTRYCDILRYKFTDLFNQKI